MATFNSPKNRTVNLALYSDGSWKIISDLPVAEVAAQLESAVASVTAYAARVASGESTADDVDDELVVTPAVAAVRPVDVPVVTSGQPLHQP